MVKYIKSSPDLTPLPCQSRHTCSAVCLHVQAFVQYKTAAANSLTDWAFVRGQYRDQLPTAGVLRQFEELFRQHSVVVMGHSVDLGSAVATHVQGLLYSNAQYLVALCEV